MSATVVIAAIFTIIIILISEMIDEILNLKISNFFEELVESKHLHFLVYSFLSVVPPILCDLVMFHLE